MFFISQDEEIDEEFELLVLASDGLWDAVPNKVNLSDMCVYMCMVALNYPSMYQACTWYCF